MKTLKAVAVCALLAISGQSFANTAKPIQITFPKGETCHDFKAKVGKKPNQHSYHRPKPKTLNERGRDD
ncbi:hypothetical protein [Moraxella equi]|uniref:Uncharacterized protein n=1 Tax=Moraxella equi TaxID=60442 RepID=A0A378QR91_9GAMM|nr:hypothetical protein [Moraxella equi]OPH39257.1 hypothetical protein B5J93_04220 [Moraxella equi]STZ03395.1 Uncharacterised protein [Moraxella equi]